jgi:hypothetical protein
MGRRSSYNRGISSTPPEFRILGESFIAGIFAGAAIKLGINADPLAILQNTTEQTIEAMEAINPERDNSGLLALFGFACFIASIIGLFEIITQVSDWRIGGILYIAGFILGLLLAVSVL